MADYATRDADVLSKYVADDVLYQITPGMPDIVGIDAFHKHNADMFSGLERVEWVNLHQFAIGQIVINDRIDEFDPYQDVYSRPNGLQFLMVTRPSSMLPWSIR